MEPPKSSAKADDLARRLQASLAQRRPRPWKPVLLALALSTLLLVFLAWWLYPRPQLEVLQAVALDALFTPEETPRARAQLLAPAEEEMHASRLRGQTVVFHEQRLNVKPGEKPREIAVQSDAHGQAVVDWPVASTMNEFLVLHIDPSRRQGSERDRGWIYVWPKDTPLLIVDADETLIAETLDENARAALHKADQEGWRMVYLALASVQVHDFRVARGWIEKQPKMPRGPVLARRHYPGEDASEEVRREVLQSLHERFQGPMALVVQSADSAQIGKELGIRTILLGSAAAPAGVLQVRSWADLPLRR